MPRAICEDCGSLVEAELTHNGICAVGHYVHCGWGHELSPDDLIQDDVAKIIAKLEAKLALAVEALQSVMEAHDQGRMIPRSGAGGMTIEANIKGSIYVGVPAWPIEEARTTLAELTGGRE